MKLGTQKDLCCIFRFIIREINISLHILCTMTLITSYIIGPMSHVIRYSWRRGRCQTL